MRSPICTTLGHVDHGKSSILDAIRGSSIVDKEAGKITQAIGASIVPMEVVRKVCGNLLTGLNMEFTIPGLLFIDTPGHAAFTSLRKRGGNLADIAILVVDINEGFKPQTQEALEILVQSKTPFIIAANKLDLLGGFRDTKESLLKNLKSQHGQVQETVDQRVYEIVGKLSEQGIQSERFDRVEDYTKQIAIIPVSAKERIGVPELLMTIAGLAQRFLENCLACQIDGPGKATILEVKEEKGLGTTLDVIVYDGTLKVNDTIVVGHLGEPIVTKVKALLEPAPLAEMRDQKTKFRSVKCASAATGVKIAANSIEKAISGMPVRACLPGEVERIKEKVKEEVQEVFIDTDDEGLVIKADSLGSLEAMINILRDKDIPIKRARIGNISKKDIVEAEANMEREPLLACILGFNVTDKSDMRSEVKVITSDVIYHILDQYEEWKQEMTRKEEEKELQNLVKPFKIQLMDGYVFRQSNPAVCGVDVLEGTLKTQAGIMNKDGHEIARVKGIQLEQKNIEKAEKGKQVALSMTGVIIGRQVHEGDILYSALPEDDFKKYKELKRLVTPEDKELLREIAEIKRKENPVWGI